MEYIDAHSGLSLNVDMLEKAALEIGRWQGKIFAKPELSKYIMKHIKNLGNPDFLERNFSQWHTQTMTYEYIISDKCQLPSHINKYYKENKERINHDKSIEYNILRADICDLPQHLKQMLFDVDEKQNEIFKSFKRLPIVFCQRDFWIENIFYDNGDIIVIDWDTAGWGFLGEDIAQLIFDDIDVRYFNEYKNRLIPSYYKGFTEFAEIMEEDINNSKAAIRDFILIIYGYHKAQRHMFTVSVEKKAQVEKELQNIFEFKV
jgi:thiamine kinase-like enzyme